MPESTHEIETDNNAVQQQQANEQQLAEEEERPQTPPGFIPLDKHQKDVNVQHKKWRDEERQHAKARERAEKAERELADFKSTQAEHQIPPPPDPYSTSYADDVATRDEAIRQHAENEAAVKQAEGDQLREKEASTERERVTETERISAFDANTLSLGLDPAGTKKAADTVIDYGISATLANHVMEDPDGPLMVQYLSENPVVLDELNGLTPYQLNIRITDDIRAKASLLKPQTSNAPAPPQTVKGGGVPEQKESWEAGAKYE